MIGILKRIIGPGRSLPGSRGYSGGAANRRARCPEEGPSPARRRSRTASRTGGICTSSGRARPRSPGTARPRRPPSGTSGGRLRHVQHLVHALAEPLEPVGCGRLGDAGADDEDVVATLGHAVEPGVPELAQLALELRARHRVPDRPRDGHAEPRARRLLLPEPVEDEEAGRHRPAVPVDGVEVPRPGQAVRTLHEPKVTPKAWRGP